MEDILLKLGCAPGVACVSIPTRLAMQFALYPIVLCLVVIPQLWREFNFYRKSRFDFSLDSGKPTIGLNLLQAIETLSVHRMSVGGKKFTALLGLLTFAAGHVVYIIAAICLR